MENFKNFDDDKSFEASLIVVASRGLFILGYFERKMKNLKRMPGLKAEMW